MGEAFKYQSSWKTEDLFKNYYSKSEIIAILTGYLKLDQITPEAIINGKPLFTEGLKIGNSTTYFYLNGDILQLYVNGVLIQTWTGATVAPVIETGQPMGLLVSLTYQT